MKITATSLPEKSILRNTEYDYVDSFQGEYHDADDRVRVVDMGRAFFNSAPSWVAFLFDLRNRIVSVFGLKTSEKTENHQEILANFKCEPGESIGFFKVYDKSENEVILGEDDKHLNFRVSIYKEDSLENDGKKTLNISTTVLFNNWLGKLYFLPVRPFHKLIVPIMLRGVLKQLDPKNN